MLIYCCKCEEKVEARLTSGMEIYPHRHDLVMLPFWKCDKCMNFVGCHHKTDNSTRPLGCIPTPEIKKARQEIHKILDPIWQSGKMSRKDVYAKLTENFNRRYHTANIRSIEEARDIYRFIKTIN